MIRLKLFLVLLFFVAIVMVMLPISIVVGVIRHLLVATAAIYLIAKHLVVGEPLSPERLLDLMP